MDSQACSRCGRKVKHLYVLRGTGGDAGKCLRCALQHWPLVRRSLFIALFVGTVLTAINQGTILAKGQFPAALCWKIPLTYCVPFLVATFGALSSSRR